jgi:ketosteroid isomerase-like protein
VIAGGALLLACVGASAAQDPARQIETEVWLPLLRASNAFDAEGFLAVYSKELVRVALDAGDVYGFPRYETEIRDGFARARTRSVQRRSDVRFLARRATADVAWETGYFRSETRLGSGEERVRYSRFEFVLRKEGGKWRILVDKDTADEGRITEAMFLAAAPPERNGQP